MSHHSTQCSVTSDNVLKKSFHGPSYQNRAYFVILYTQETTKLTKKNSTEKHKWKRAECDHVKKNAKKKPAEKIPSGTWK
jgi:hypothetical protein